jgi:hypothetical protein
MKKYFILAAFVLFTITTSAQEAKLPLNKEVNRKKIRKLKRPILKQ